MDKKKIKCVVWDLDRTLWEGILSEGDEVGLRNGILTIIKELDRRGILQSISSKNEYIPTMKKLKEFGIEEYFLYPQINWGPKSDSIKRIQEALNIGIDSFAFIDDQMFELEEVKFSCPEVECILAERTDELLNMEMMMPRFITDESSKRRILYMNDKKRRELEEVYDGPQQEFLKTLKMKFTISLATEKDLKRLEELTIRTHQLNSTGNVYSYDELRQFIHSNRYEVIVAQLDDKYGEYGKIGLLLYEKRDGQWIIKLLLMSCRVMSKGVGSILLRYIINDAKRAGVSLIADFTPTDKNKIMYITYKFAGFNELSNEGESIRLEADMSSLSSYPDYVEVQEDTGER